MLVRVIFGDQSNIDGILGGGSENRDLEIGEAVVVLKRILGFDDLNRLEGYGMFDLRILALDGWVLLVDCDAGDVLVEESVDDVAGSFEGENPVEVVAVLYLHPDLSYYIMLV